MGIFGINYNKPGPGVDKNAPKKKGITRFFELVLREFGNLTKLNLLYLLTLLPSVTLFILALSETCGIYMYILSVVAALPVGGAVTACSFCIAKMLRDEPGFVFYDFRRKLKENFKQAAIPGILSIAFIYTQIYIWLNIAMGGIIAGYGTFLMLILSMIFIRMIIPYVFLQTAYLHLKTIAIIKNSILISLKNAGRSFSGMLLGNAIPVATFFLYPLSMWWMPILLFWGLSLPQLLNLMFIWPPVDEVFHISETLITVQEEKIQDISPVFVSKETVD